MRDFMEVLARDITSVLTILEPTELPMTSSATLRDLREAVCKLESCDFRSISLLMNGDPLLHSGAEKLLSECGIVNGTNLTLILRVLPTVLTASGDRTAKIWDSFTGECRQTLSGHGGIVPSAVFSADAQRFSLLRVTALPKSGIAPLASVSRHCLAMEVL